MHSHGFCEKPNFPSKPQPLRQYHPVGQLLHMRQPCEVTSSLEAVSLSDAAPSFVEDLSCEAAFRVRQLDDVSQPIQMRKAIQ